MWKLITVLSVVVTIISLILLYVIGLPFILKSQKTEILLQVILYVYLSLALILGFFKKISKVKNRNSDI